MTERDQEKAKEKDKLPAEETPKPDMKKVMEELGSVEAHIEQTWERLQNDIKGVNPKDLRRPVYQWYWDGIEQLQPFYQQARYLHELVTNHLLGSLEDSSKNLETSSRRLTGLTWGLLSLTIVLIALTAIDVLLRVL